MMAMMMVSFERERGESAAALRGVERRERHRGQLVSVWRKAEKSARACVFTRGEKRGRVKNENRGGG
jgi:hypothetical protein